MDRKLKQHIRIIAEKFNHRIELQKDVIVLKNEVNEIKLRETDKHRINISYNINENQLDILKVETENVYDTVLELLTRNEQEEKPKMKTGILLTIEDWINEEGNSAKEQLEELKRDLRDKQIQFRELGGNRYVAEYYNGILILIDDLCWAKSNVIPI